MLLILLPIAGGIVWYESQPTTVKIPVEVETQPTTPVIYEEPETTTTTTRASKPKAPIDFSTVRVHMEIRGVDGDNVDMVLMIHNPQEVSHLPRTIQEVIQGCDTLTDRDRVIRIDTKLELTSSLPAEVNVDYQTTGMTAVYDLTSGPVCKTDGDIKHTMKPGGANVFSYWVLIRGYITPEMPDGDYTKSWYVSAPDVTLPNGELMHLRMWGSYVVKCHGLLSDFGRVELAGHTTAGEEGCEPAIREDQALVT